MKHLAVAAILLSLVASVLAQSDQGLRISRNGSQPSAQGAVENFTELLDGKSVDWLEKVTDGQYRSPTLNTGEIR